MVCNFLIPSENMLGNTNRLVVNSTTEIIFV